MAWPLESVRGAERYSALATMSGSAVQYDNIGASALRKETPMPAMTGPARYLFLRRTHGTEDVPRWPPAVKPHQWPDNRICTAVRLALDEAGWRVEGVEDGVEDGAEPAEGTPEGFRLSREMVLGPTEAEPRDPRLNGHAAGPWPGQLARLLSERRGNPAAFDVLGVRAVRPDEKGPEYASHVVVRVQPGTGRGLPKEAVVIPTGALVLGGYFERGGRAEVSFLGLRLTPDELANLQPYLPDAAIQGLAERALDRAVPTPRARHDMLVEVEAGRVALHGRAELDSTGDAAIAELEATRGVIEVVDHLQYDEALLQRVHAALAAKGLGDLDVMVEHNLVSLHGVVPDRKAYHAARDAALKIPGVRGVVSNQLLVAPLMAAAAPARAPIVKLPSANDRPDIPIVDTAPREPSRTRPRPKQKGDLAKSR